MLFTALAWFTSWLAGGGTVIYSVLQAVGIIKTAAYVSGTIGALFGAVFGAGASASVYYFLFGSQSNENHEVMSVHRVWILVPAIVMLQYAAIVIRHLLQQQVHVQVDNTQQSRFQTRRGNNNNNNSSNKWSWLCFYLCLATSFIFVILFLIDLHMLQLQSVFILALVCLTVYHVVIIRYVMLTH